MNRLVNIAIFILLLSGNANCQTYPALIYHAYSDQIIVDSSGVSNGWKPCDISVRFYMSNNNMDSILIDSYKHLGITIKELKAGYRIENTYWDVYTGYDSEILESVQIEWGLFEKKINNQLSLLKIKFTDFTFSLKLESPKEKSH